MVATAFPREPTVLSVVLPRAPKRKAATYDDIYNKWLAKTHDHHVARDKADAWKARQERP